MSHTDSDKLNEARDVMISAIAQSMEIYGVSPSVGRIYGVLYYSEEPMSLEDIKDEVAMSKASVSNGMRELLDTEMVIKVWKKGERKDHFIAEKDFLKNFINYFVKQIRHEKNLIMKASEQAKPVFDEMLKSDDNHVRDAAQKDKKNMESTFDYFDWTMRLAYAMETGEIFDYFPKKEEKGEEDG
ncbi:GbsR/MarR family transcriptional regulator [Salisediminibacterium halotolerans]|uniref:HTH-type transcriptional regulator n=1 Tax=Salisediminibacterium halotolerans TaxID=517425 RepID=A0A1H9WXX2_9BACI|nr:MULTISPECIES: transcriptional regulator [Salisediminibacterium]RLJ74358.1 DNA-binding transcriptional regulator GbsR (MarR family) [Actinophytocola xinjiangensis]RPE87549.1 DNA-binding transcriptional regulator GbsR (MarR family) [Salisediminibacterium halotolerans]TWG35195.1 DNA-binding transcriptional regulator GbsR (MarR family) [Salisediminibacterium halotolerans]SES38705.1 DNA-binding transcriptional regulator GbsR, MarR family [Salisediminibacterium haloalkalitolerans]GEL08867.1 GbsR/